MQKRKAASNRTTATLKSSPSPPPERKGSGKEKESKDKRHRIRLRFRDWAARMVSERRWHPSQQLTWIDEGNDLLEITGFEEVRRWIPRGARIRPGGAGEAHDPPATTKTPGTTTLLAPRRGAFMGRSAIRGFPSLRSVHPRLPSRVPSGTLPRNTLVLGNLGIFNSQRANRFAASIHFFVLRWQQGWQKDSGSTTALRPAILSA